MYILRLATFIFLSTLFSITTEASEETVYSFGTVPFMPIKRLEQIMAPIAVDMGRHANAKIRYQSPASYVKFMAKLESEVYDLAHVHPFDYVRIARQHNYLPLFSRNEELYALIVARKDSHLKTLTDLKGKTLALPPKVAAISYMTLNTLLETGFDLKQDIKIIHTKSHASCLQKVLSRQADACGAPAPAFRVFTTENNVEFLELGRSTPLPHSIFIAHKRIAKEQREAIIKGMLESRLESIPPKLRIFFIPNNNQSIKPFRHVKDNEYDVVAEYWRKVQELNLD